MCQVGPKKKNLKVKDFDEVDFKPQELVSNISQIYINLGQNEEFCLAVSGDGRSYSHDLFQQAEIVLWKIQRPPEMIMQFNEWAAKVKVGTICYMFCFIHLAATHHLHGDLDEFYTLYLAML